MKSLLCLVGDGEDPSRLSRSPSRQTRAKTWPVSVVPGSFDQDPAHVAVPGLRDGPAPVRAATGVLARHQAQVGHELPR
jgi:hypothetical protein